MSRLTIAFEGIASEYERWRPRYPPSILAPVVEALEPLGAALLVDVGAGTGISTRLLRDVFGPQVRILGVEPGPVMREQARAYTPSEAMIEYREGSAESIPLASGAAALVLAAQAYQWFDRPTFVAEARRVLAPRGVLAVLQNDRDWTSGGVAADYEDFLERYSPGYTRTYRAFATADEIVAAGGFAPVTERELSWTRRMPVAEFPSFALTSSKTQAVVSEIGSERTRAELLQIAASAAGPDGSVVVPYVTRLTWARYRG
jgi:ubiquinone/menaquinone biosynthesis C-methylase UbiE